MKKTIIVLALSFAILTVTFRSIVYSQGNQSKTDIHKLIQTKTHSLFDSLVSFRRDLHQHPELAGQEIRTAEKIKDFLLALGLEVKTGIGGNGVIGILRGKEPGRIVAWRADIDAMKTDDPDVVDFKSKIQGVRHICGHDVHTTIALGIADVLSSLKNSFNGTIVFIFQPSEENFKGAKKMLDAGLFDIIKPDAIFGLHLFPLPTGILSSKPKELFWRGKVLTINIEGTEGLDKAADNITNLLLGISTEPENSPYFNIKTLMDKKLGLGNPQGIYSNYFVTSKKQIEKENTLKGMLIKAEFDGSSENNFKIGLAKLQDHINNSEYKKYVKSIAYTKNYPTVYNDSSLTESSARILKSIYGDSIYHPVYGANPFFNDDYAYFQEQVPGVYFLLGASNFEKGQISIPHSPNFFADEECIKYGVEYFSSMLFEYLKSESKK
jgi:metal-dependent amidase/aminoacylase/carboxypeptidase family protein